MPSLPSGANVVIETTLTEQKLKSFNDWFEREFPKNDDGHCPRYHASMKFDLMLLAWVGGAALSAPASGWLPIESAPKDGTRILIFQAGARRQVQEASWAIPYESATGYWATPIGPLGRGYTILPESPTHWMPLPASPVEKNS